VLAHGPQQRRLRLGAGRTGLGEARRHDHEAVHAGRGAVGHDGGHRVGGDRDDGEVDVRRAGEGRDGAQAADHLGGRVDRHEGAGEAGGLEMGQQRGADAGAARAGAVDGHAARVEQPADRAGLRALLAVALHAHRVGRGGDREPQVHDAVGELALDVEAGGHEHAQHGPVLGQHVGLELGDALLAGRGDQVLDQHRADASPLVRVLDDEGDLGLVRAGAEALVAADGDEPTAVFDHERLAVAVVDVDEAVQVALGDPGVRREVPQVSRALREAGVQRDDALGVVWPDRSQVDGCPVREQHVGGAVVHAPSFPRLGYRVSHDADPG
jgi:hypothetical protein